MHCRRTHLWAVVKRNMWVLETLEVGAVPFKKPKWLFLPTCKELAATTLEGHESLISMQLKVCGDMGRHS